MKIDKVIINIPPINNIDSDSESDNKNKNDNSLSTNYNDSLSSSDSDDEYIEKLSIKDKKEIKMKVQELLSNIHSLNDLILIGDYFKEKNKYFKQCKINQNDDILMYRISKINLPLKDLMNMIGMNEVKKTIFYQTIFIFVQFTNLNKIIYFFLRRKITIKKKLKPFYKF